MHDLRSPLTCRIDQHVARIRLDRADIHNAFDDTLIAALTAMIEQLGNDPAVRVIELGSEGASFSAGADLNWMRRMALASEDANRFDALELARLMRTLAFCPKPTIARVQGSAFGGGVGLIACCDIAIGIDTAKFGLTEARLGLVPAVISPYVIDAIGMRAAQRWFLTAELFDAQAARDSGLLHEVVAVDQLDQACARVVKSLLGNGPQAVSEAKHLVRRIAGRSLAEQVELDTHNATLIARLRVSVEGQEGLGAFLNKRRADYAL